MKYRLQQKYRVNKVDDNGFTTEKYINLKQYSIWEIVQDHWAKNDYEIILQQTKGKQRYWVGLSFEKFNQLFEQISFEVGDKVYLNYEKIKLDLSNRLPKYVEFVENNKNKLLTIRKISSTGVLAEFEEDDVNLPWLFDVNLLLEFKE